MGNLRHGSLQMNVIYIITKLQSWGHDSKSEISVKKITVEKLHFNLYFLRNKSDCICVLYCLLEDKITFLLLYNTFKSNEE